MHNRRCNTPNMRQELKKQMGLQNGDETTYSYEYGKKSTPTTVQPDIPVKPKGSEPSIFTTSGFATTSLYFDSEFRNGISELSSGEVTFNVSELNNQRSLTNVVQMKINAFNFPNIPNPNQTSGVDYNFDQTVFMTIPEFPTTQGFQAYNSKNYYFKFRVTNENGAAVYLEPVDNVFTFNQPITSIDTFTMKFYKPQNFQPINLPPDILNIETVIAGTGSFPARFRILPPYDTTVIGSIGALTGGDRVAVRISEFISPNSTVNTTTTDQQGYFIDNIISNSIFSISVLDHTALTTTVSGKLYIKKNKIAVDFTFTSLENHPTNFIQPVKV